MPKEKLFSWKKEYELGIKEIDAEHKNIIRIMNDLYFILEEKIDAKATEMVLKDLLQYSKYHFATEEKYFKKFHYADAAGHIKHHHFFTKKIQQIYKKNQAGEKNVTFELIDFLEDWFLEHVILADKDYVECFNKHGLK